VFQKRNIETLFLADFFWQQSESSNTAGFNFFSTGAAGQEEQSNRVLVKPKRNSADGC
jgi:hypothetical protein